MKKKFKGFFKKKIFKRFFQKNHLFKKKIKKPLKLFLKNLEFSFSKNLLIKKNPLNFFLKNL